MARWCAVYESSFATLRRFRQSATRLGVVTTLVGWIVVALLSSAAQFDEVVEFGDSEGEFLALEAEVRNLPSWQGLLAAPSRLFLDYPHVSLEVFDRLRESGDLSEAFAAVQKPDVTLLDLFLYYKQSARISLVDGTWSWIKEDTLEPVASHLYLSKLSMGELESLGEVDLDIATNGIRTRFLSHLDTSLARARTEAGVTSETLVVDAVHAIIREQEARRALHQNVIDLFNPSGLARQEEDANTGGGGLGTRWLLDSTTHLSVPVALLSEEWRSWSERFRAMLTRRIFSAALDDMRTHGQTLQLTLLEMMESLRQRRREMAERLSVTLESVAVQLPFAFVLGWAPIALAFLGLLTRHLFGKVEVAMDHVRRLEGWAPIGSEPPLLSVDSMDSDRVVRMFLLLGLAIPVVLLESYRVFLAAYSIAPIRFFSVAAELVVCAALAAAYVALIRRDRRSAEERAVVMGAPGADRQPET